jgi:hypothetical protein
VSRDPRAEARLDVDTTESRILTSLAQVATSLDAAEEALVVARRDLDTPHESLPEWAMRNNAQWWLAAARFEEDERDAVRFLSSALGRWDDRGELYMRADADDVAAALTEWYLAREEQAA